LIERDTKRRYHFFHAGQGQVRRSGWENDLGAAPPRLPRSPLPRCITFSFDGGIVKPAITGWHGLGGAACAVLLLLVSWSSYEHWHKQLIRDGNEPSLSPASGSSAFVSFWRISSWPGGTCTEKYPDALAEQ
jgi:hypothetical protein